MCDLMWSRPESAYEWFEDFLAARWGSREWRACFAPEIKKVFYSVGGVGCSTIKSAHDDGPDEPDPIVEARPLANHLLDHKELWDRPLFRDDTLDVCNK